MTVNNSKGSKETFEKFKSVSIGDPFQDAGQYILRKPENRSQSQLTKAWVQSGSNKTVRKSEFPYIELGPPARPKPEPLPRFGTRVKADPFTSLNKLGYSLEPYERAQDIERADYRDANNKILFRDQPFTNTVKQKGTFFPHHKTYGTDKEFPEKKPSVTPQPLFGPFKDGDPLKTGYNKCIGGRNGSTEEQYLEE